MTEQKCTDEQIVKALECCCEGECAGCIYDEQTACKEYLLTATLSLIISQKAEIDRLQRLGAAATRKMVNARAEAIKEFAERLKEYLDDFYTTGEDALFDTVSAIDEIVKELTEGE